MSELLRSTRSAAPLECHRDTSLSKLARPSFPMCPPRRCPRKTIPEQALTRIDLHSSLFPLTIGNHNDIQSPNLSHAPKAATQFYCILMTGAWGMVAPPGHSGPADRRSRPTKAMQSGMINERGPDRKGPGPYAWKARLRGGTKQP